VTAQINDRFFFRKHEYSVAGISEGELFDPSLLDLKPAGTCSACWRGYQAVFGVSDSRLVLATLHVNLLLPGEGYQRQEGPIINGVSPAGPKDRHDWFNNHYDGINYHLEYSGGLLLADGFLRELYVHMGFHPAWKYETVIELIFEGGILRREFDRSERIGQIRNMFLESRAEGDSEHTFTEEDIARFVERAFDRSYRW